MKRFGKTCSAILLALLFYFCPNFSRADTNISGGIISDTVWSPSGGVYIIDSSFYVASGTTLNIEPGTIIKSKTTNINNTPTIHGRLIADATPELPIYFTSLNDDSVGGDTNNDGLSYGNPGDWQGFYFSPGSQGFFNNVNIVFAGAGGYGWGNFSGIKNDHGKVSIQNSNVSNTYSNLFDWVIGNYRSGNAIYNKNGILTVVNSTINNSGNGIYIESGTTTVSDSIIQNNMAYSAGYGVFAYSDQMVGKLTLINNNFSGNSKTANINNFAEFVHNGNTSNDISDKGFRIGGIINKNTYWHSDDLPIIVDGQISINAGSELKIKSGTIIKIGDVWGNGSFDVYGSLIAEGTQDSKIYFTSMKDDSVGGDTNGDGDTTIPAKRNWFGIILNPGGEVNLKNTTVKYSGYNANGEYLSGIAATIYNRGGDLFLEDSLFSDNSSPVIFQDIGTTTISKSEIVAGGGGNIGVWSRGGYITISQSSLLSSQSGYGVYNQSGVDLGPWWQTKPLQVIDARNNWWGDPTGPKDASTSTPTGNGSFVSENVLYTPFLTAPPDEQQSIDPVIIIPGIMGSAYKNGELVIDPILHTYDDLLATLVANGYEEGKDLFTFPYEWRDSNVLNASFLRNKINQIQEICSCEKVDIVAHSMGGLIARQYIQSDNYGDDIDQIIFLGTPHKGSPKSYLQKEGGASDRDIRSKLINSYFFAEAKKNGFSGVYEYINERPIASVKELLPIFDYIKDKDTGTLREYPENYPRNEFLENLNNNIDDLLNSGIEITNIVGDSGDNKTIHNIRVVPSTRSGLWEYGEPDNFYQLIFSDNGLERGIGDDTVSPLGSTLAESISNTESGYSHNMIPTMEANNIFNILTGKNSQTNINNDYGVGYGVLVLQLLCPVDFVVIAPDGKKIGKNFVSGGEYNEIPNAFYSGHETEEEYITILNPLDGEYKIELQGTDDGGEYGVLTSYISDEFATTTETTGLTEPNQITKLSFELDNNNPENIEIEKEVSVESIIIDINKAYDLGWITDKKVRDSLIKQVKLIIKFEEKRNGKYEKRVDKIILKILEKELELLKKKGKINQEAYNIIKDDLNWLVLNN